MSQFDSKILKANPRLLVQMLEIDGESNKESHRWSFFTDRGTSPPLPFDPGRWRKRWTGKSGARIDLWD